MAILPICTPLTEWDLYRENALKALPGNENPILKPLWDGSAWKESINVSAPNGQLIPVDRPNSTFTTLFSIFPIRTADDRDMVSVPENPINLQNLDSCYRIALVYRTYRYPSPQNDPSFKITLSTPIDYSKYGFIKIGRTWVDPSNQKDVEAARKLQDQQENQQGSSCVVQ